MSRKKSMPQHDHHAVGADHHRLNQHGELPRDGECDGGICNEQDLERMKEKGSAGARVPPKR